jgi:Uma2 family endonuclease
MSDMLAASSERVRLRPITVDDYHRMGDAGILRPDERVQLISGRIIAMPPIGPEHAYRVRRIGRLLEAVFGGRAVVSAQQPITLDTLSEPEPDIALVRLPEKRYEFAHPTSADVLLVIEVADATLRTDRGRKLRAYARSGVPEYWIVNLTDGVVETYTDPDRDRYRTKRIVQRGEAVSPLAFPDDVIAADDLLPAISRRRIGNDPEVRSDE